MKALALSSGGLDSALAIKLVLEQGIEVVGLNIVLPIAAERKDYAGQVAEQLGIHLLRFEAGEDYIEVIRYPKYGYGRNMNPCIDCRIYMLRQAKRIAGEIGADCIITGDVLGERTMSQSRKKLKLEEREAGLQGMILRPLSARLLPPTIAERQGWVDRSRLLRIWGRSRKPQINLAEEMGIEGYRFPDGGCLLTCNEYAAKIKRLFEHKETVTIRDIQLLKIGRHFHNSSSKVIVGRNERENRLLLEMKKPGDWIFEVPGYGSPVTILESPCDEEGIELAAKLTARYSDADGGSIAVEYRRGDERRTITVSGEQVN